MIFRPDVAAFVDVFDSSAGMIGFLSTTSLAGAGARAVAGAAAPLSLVVVGMDAYFSSPQPAKAAAIAQQSPMVRMPGASRMPRMMTCQDWISWGDGSGRTRGGRPLAMS